MGNEDGEIVKKALSSFVQVLVYLIMFSYWAMGSVSYLWSIYIAYKETGLIGSIITFLLPVVGQIYWVYRMWSEQGFDSMFVFISVAAVVTYIASLLLLLFISFLSKDVSNDITDDKKDKLYGYGGWLIFFSIGQAYTLYVAISNIFVDVIPSVQNERWSELTDKNSESYSSLWYPFIYAEVIQALILSILAAIIVYMTFTKSKHYKNAQITYVIVIFMFGTIATVIFSGINSDYGEEVYPNAITPLIRSIWYVVLWIPYFLKSKRVANTFIN